MLARKHPLLAAFNLVFVPLLLAACGGSDDPPPTPAPPTQPESAVQVGGALDRPGAVTLTQLKTQPAITQTVNFSSGTGAQTHTYVGASLWTLLNGLGIQVNAAVKNDVLGKYVLATGSDGYKTVFSLGELNPDFGNRPSLVAYAEVLNGATAALSTDGPLRVTAPGDGKGGRYVSGLVRLDVRASGSTVAATDGAVSTQFTVSGAVKQSMTFDAAALLALPAVTRTVGGNTYTGVSLWDLLNTTVGLATDPAAKNASLGMYAVATGSDGYKALISLGELDPGFGNQPDLIAYDMNGAGLGGNGFARLVIPNDGKAGRYVSNLISLEVFAAPPAQ
ncbi:molybdopterin-binding oxidoreductase [Cupriavidus sp. 30B13]|uniref:molybdopterin-binding oxidoreductase n=1 Tax=Cupriavidus sp. 30B13 TaxID=3384241 RepID=UPI003B9096A6